MKSKTTQTNKQQLENIAFQSENIKSITLGEGAHLADFENNRGHVILHLYGGKQTSTSLSIENNVPYLLSRLENGKLTLNTDYSQFNLGVDTNYYIKVERKQDGITLNSSNLNAKLKKLEDYTGEVDARESKNRQDHETRIATLEKRGPQGSANSEWSEISYHDLDGSNEHIVKCKTETRVRTEEAGGKILNLKEFIMTLDFSSIEFPIRGHVFFLENYLQEFFRENTDKTHTYKDSAPFRYNGESKSLEIPYDRQDLVIFSPYISVSFYQKYNPADDTIEVDVNSRGIQLSKSEE